MKKKQERSSILMNRSILLIITLVLTLSINGQTYFTMSELLKICGSKYEPYSGLVDKKRYKVQDVIDWGVREKVFNFYKGCVIDGLYKIHSVSNPANASVMAIYVDVMQTGITTRMIETVFKESIYNKMKQDAINAGYRREVWTDVTPNKEFYIKDDKLVIEFSAGRNQYGVDCYQIDVKVFGYYKAEKEKRDAKKYEDLNYVKNLDVDKLISLEQTYKNNTIIKEVLYEKLMNEQRYSEAIMVCSRLIELDYNGSKYWEYLAFMRLKGLGIKADPEQAYYNLEQAYKINKISPNGIFQLALFVLKRGGDKASYAYYRDYVRAEKLFKSIENEIPEAKNGVKLAQRMQKQAIGR